jgi:hypothetical protein
MPQRKKRLPTIELRPTAGDNPPIGNDPLPGEKPHIWQEFKRDMHMRRDAGEPIIGRGWPVMVVVGLVIAALTFLETSGGPEWLLALRNLF